METENSSIESTNNSETTEPEKICVKHTLCLTLPSGKCVAIIPKGTELPVMRTVVFKTTEIDQPNMILDLMLGESKDPLDNCPYSKLKIDKLPFGAAGATLVRVTFKSYLNSVYDISIRFSEFEEGRTLTIFPAIDLSPEEIKDIDQKIKRKFIGVVPFNLGTAKTIIPMPKEKELLI